MELIETFLALNRDIVFFVYGLVFFVLGLSIALQSRSYSRLDLARSLKWLAAFGFTHAFHEWGDLFIPIQSAYLGPEMIDLLHYLHLILLALSFAFLFEFGVALLRPLGRGKGLSGVSSGLFAVWLFVAFFPLPQLFPDRDTWYNLANALARYFIGFPGGLLAAYSLRQHALERIVPLNVPHIVKMLRFGGVMLAIYAVFGGLIPPPVPFFPGNVINSASFEAALLAPPAVFRSIIGLGLVIAIIRALEVFDVETDRMIEAMEQGQILAAERNRLARQLHDGAIQKVYTAGLLVESAQKLAEGDHLTLSNRLIKAEAVLDDAISDLRRNLGELQTTPSEEPFATALKNLALDPRFRSLVNVKLDLDLPEEASLSPVRADHVLAIVNEALSNVVRHARARQIDIAVQSRHGRLKVVIQDDGVGIQESQEAGYGLRNMRDRARLLGGNVEVSSANGRGTLVIVDVPWVDDR